MTRAEFDSSAWAWGSAPVITLERRDGGRTLRVRSYDVSLRGFEARMALDYGPHAGVIEAEMLSYWESFREVPL